MVPLLVLLVIATVTIMEFEDFLNCILKLSKDI